MIPKSILLPVAFLLVVNNTLCFILMAHDKRCARKGLWRVPEKKLFLSAGLFGALGGVLGMVIFRHKTRHWYFRIFFPVMLFLQAALIAAGLYFVYL